MSHGTDVSRELDSVEEGHLVVWNGRSNPQAVVEVAGSWFEVKSRQGSYYRFYPGGGYLVNRQSDNEYQIEEFRIVGELYDVSVW